MSGEWPKPSTGASSAAGLRRWTRLVLIAAAVLALAIIAMLLAGGPGGHGPSRHVPPDSHPPPQAAG